MKETDRRSLRTKKALKRVMLELLRKKDISKITVSEIANLADIGRGTFYLHYTDPYDLLDKLEDELIEQLTANTTHDQNEDSLMSHLENVWRNVYENKDTFNIFMNSINKGRFMDKLKQKSGNEFLVKYQGDPQKFPEYYSVVYVISGTLGIFQKWMEEGTPISPDELAKIVKNCVI